MKELQDLIKKWEENISQNEIWIKANKSTFPQSASTLETLNGIYSTFLTDLKKLNMDAVKREDKFCASRLHDKMIKEYGYCKTCERNRSYKQNVLEAD